MFVHYQICFFCFDNCVAFQVEEMSEEQLREFLKAVKRHNQQMLGAPADESLPSSSAALPSPGVAVATLVAHQCSRSPSLLRANGNGTEDEGVSTSSIPSREVGDANSRPPTPDTRPVTPVIAEVWSEADGGGPFQGLGAARYPDESNLLPEELPSYYTEQDLGQGALPVLSEEDIREVLEAAGPLPTDSEDEQQVPLGHFDNPIDAAVQCPGEVLVGPESVEIVRASGRELAEQMMMRAMIVRAANHIESSVREESGRRGRGRPRGSGRGGARGGGEARGRGEAHGRGGVRGRGDARGRGRARGRGAVVTDESESAAAEANAALFGGHHLRATASRRQATGKGGKK